MPQPTKEQITEKLTHVIDPELRRSIVELGMVRSIDIGDDGIGLPPDFAEWRDAGNGMVSVRYRLQQVGAQLNVTSDDLGLRFQIILHPRHLRATPARGNFVWL
jgi:metal-sulfur cluster biosynthetic enzyme